MGTPSSSPPKRPSWQDSGEQSVVTVRFENMPDGMLLIRKVCDVNPSITLQDAEFKIAYADGTLIGDSNGIFRTDENGEIRISGLKPGKSVVVTETPRPGRIYPGYAEPDGPDQGGAHGQPDLQEHPQGCPHYPEARQRNQ